MESNTFIGLDVHKASISVAVARGERGGEVRHWGSVPNRPDHIRKLVEKLAASGAQLRFCYEAGPCAMASTASWSRWGMTASWSRPR